MKALKAFFRFDRERFRLRNTAPYLLAFFIPVLVMLIIFMQRGIWPFGERCFLRTDLYHQYAPFFQELKLKFSTGGSLEYSWNIGGGTNFWALSAYYLASPLNVLTALCPQKYIIEFVTLMILIKLGFSSVTMTYYLNRRHLKHGLAAYPAVFFGIFYALSGYMAAYQWNVMWLDCIWLFPLVLLGLERLFKEGKGLLYSFTLGLTILSNYYIAIMVCMGIFVYCFFLLGTEKEMKVDFGKKFAKFAGYTALAVVFSSMYLVPYISYFHMTASAENNFKFEWYSYFSVFDMMCRHLVNVDVHTGLDHWPNIYCGVAVFLLLPFYYLNKKILLREKIGYTILLVFFYFSFSTRSMDYIWHVMHIPNSLPCRQAFIYIFLLLVMSYRGFLGLKDRSFREITLVMIFALGFVIAAEKLQTDPEYYHIYTFYVSAVFMILYVLLAYAYRKGRIYRDILVVMLLTLAAIESCINTGVTSIPTVNRNDYTSFDSGTRAIMQEIREGEGDPNGFYRVEKTTLRTKNDGAWLSYPSASTFSSVANANLTTFYKYLGLESSTNAYSTTGHTFFTDMLFGIRYSVTRDALDVDNSLYRLYDEQDKVFVYRNNYALPLGAALIPNIDNAWSTSGNPIENQNGLARLFYADSPLFINTTGSYSKDKKIQLEAAESGYYYAYSPRSGPKEIEVVHGDFKKTFSNLNRSITMDLGYVEAGTVINFENVEKDSTKTLNLNLYRFNEEVLPEVYNAMTKAPFIVDDYDDTHVNGHITLTENATLYTTIAYEEGWSVTVDGKPARIIPVKEAYISVPLEAGTHDVRFSFRVPYLTAGIILTLLSGAVMLLIAVLARINELKKERQDAPDEVPALPVADDEKNPSAADDGKEPSAADDDDFVFPYSP